MSGRNPAYCATCCDAAEKAGRPVKLTDQYEYPVCPVCETRLRNGLIHYIPSNGTEGMMFEERCNDCRHYGENPEGFSTCAHKILDRMLESGWEDRDSAKSWYDPADLRNRHDDGSPMCPAECLRFIHKNHPDAARYDPPPSDCAGQLLFDDLDVPVERVPQRQGVPA